MLSRFNPKYPTAEELNILKNFMEMTRSSKTIFKIPRKSVIFHTEKIPKTLRFSDNKNHDSGF
jgi:hypothetical protein